MVASSGYVTKSKTLNTVKKELSAGQKEKVPTGKDPGDDYQSGIDIRAWALSGLPPFWQIGCPNLDSHQEGEGPARENIEPENTGGRPDPVEDARRLIVLGHQSHGSTGASGGKLTGWRRGIRPQGSTGAREWNLGTLLTY